MSLPSDPRAEVVTDEIFEFVYEELKHDPQMVVETIVEARAA